MPMREEFFASRFGQVRDRFGINWMILHERPTPPRARGSPSERQWGKMSVAQTIAHCAFGLQMALAEIRLPRALMGRLVGSAIKPKVVGNDDPLRRNSPKVRELVIRGEPNLDAERVRLCSLIDKFVSGGASVCTTHPHPFFGPLTPAEWAVLMYKHLDHHLRQLGV